MAGRVQRVVRAAGGIVLREGARGLEIAVVHRPQHDDWSFPKGKLEADENEELAALREVEEETGLRCELGVFVAKISYEDAKHRPKTVHYFLMRPLSGTFVKNDEVDEMRWVPLVDAGGLLSYPRDREVLAEFGAGLLARSR